MRTEFLPPYQAVAQGMSLTRVSVGSTREAVQAMCEWLFNDGSFSTIRCRILPDNEASIRLATRCGFTRVEFGPDGVRLDPDDYAILEKVTTTL